mmetsp:Transcript_35953/g.60905  ORF Transcript_35953/g.60905 Transcript_35953/m.60905 type:complete len:86 (+) Transcript_35953:101-358(+)
MFFGGFGGGYQQPQAFDEDYHCFPGAFADKPELENGDKILLPSSALDTLTRLNIQVNRIYNPSFLVTGEFITFCDFVTLNREIKK